ncbi:MAG: stage III sporulation protein AE [Eubacteriales bacterium]|nr:stage III sporulation protein AE [Eubacteriales bacterium]
MEHYLEQLNLSELMEELDGYFQKFSWDLPELFEQLLSGNFQGALSLLGQGVLAGIRQELEGFRGILVTLLLLGILSALVLGFLTSFENHQIAQIAQYIFFLLLMAVLLKIFSACYALAQETLSAMVQFSRLVLPALCLSLGPAAGSVTAAGYYQLALVLIFLVESFLLHLCLPLLPVLMLLLTVNGVWEEGRLSALTGLLEKGLKAAAKCALAAVTGLGFLQSMVSPALDSLKRSAAQKAVSAIPALGNLAESTAELLIGSAVLVKNSLGLFALLLLAGLVAGPFLQLLAYGALLKLAEALTGIVAAKQLAGCIGRTADIVFLTLYLAGTGAACFLVLTAVVTCLVGNG